MEISERYREEEKFSKINKETLTKALQEYKSLRKAAKSLNMNYTTFRKACIYNNIEYNSSKSAQHTDKYENVCWTHTMVKCEN